MAMDLALQGKDNIERARAILRENPKEAKNFGVNPATIAMAEDYFGDPVFSPNIESARKLMEMLSSLAPGKEQKGYSRFINRLSKNGFTPEGETSWQMAAKIYSEGAEWDDDTQHVQGIAIDFVSFLKRAIQDLGAYTSSPYSPLQESAKLLIQRLWSFDRRWDRPLSSDLEIWLQNFEKFVQDNPKFAELAQKATLIEMKNLMSPASLLALGAEIPRAFDLSAAPEPWIVDGAWIMFSRSGRFAEFAAPLAGAVLLIDIKIDGGSTLWQTTFEDLYPKEARLPSKNRILDWISPKRNILDTARIAGEAGVLDYQGDANVVVRETNTRAPVISFYDNATWLNATDSISELNLMMHPAPKDWQEMTQGVAETYLKLAEKGLMSVAPQFYVHRENSSVRIAGLGGIFEMKSFPYRFFIDSIVESITSKFNLISERREVEKIVKGAVLDFLKSSKLPAGIEIADLPGEASSLKKAGSMILTETVEELSPKDEPASSDDQIGFETGRRPKSRDLKPANNLPLIVPGPTIK